MRLRDKVALITGGGSGIGEAAARLFASEGARVAVADFNAAHGHRVAAEIESKGYKSLFVPVDVANPDQVSAMVAQTERTLGDVDVLFNAAGVLQYGTIAATDLASWQRVIGVNLTGTFLCCRAVLPGMLRRGRGSIINVSSTTGAHGACADAVAYVTSKGGVAALTRALAVDHAREGVRVNALCPGPTDTPMLREALTPEKLESFALSFPAGRLGKPWELAEAALFLASDASSFVTGSMLTVDGGQTAQV